MLFFTCEVIITTARVVSNTEQCWSYQTILPTSLNIQLWLSARRKELELQS